MIPIIPNIREAGMEKIISGPARAAGIVPQPGRSTVVTHMVATPIESRIAEIFPKRILTVP
jgi:hypothetical protein